MQLNKLQENTERQLKEIMTVIHEQNEKLNKETKIIKKETNRNSVAEEVNEQNEKRCNREHLCQSRLLEDRVSELEVRDSGIT